MADILNNIGQGAVGGGLTGAAFGPWGALAGIVGGGILGAFTEDPPTADELGIKPINAREMAQEFLPSEDEMRTQRNDFATRSDQSSERSAENMIAAGMDPGRAYAIASRNNAPSMNRNEQTQNAQRMTMMDNLARQFKPYEMQRDEDILNYNMSIENQPGILESFIPIAADMYMSQGAGEVSDAWGGFSDAWSGFFGNSSNRAQPQRHNRAQPQRQPAPVSAAGNHNFQPDPFNDYDR